MLKEMAVKMEGLPTTATVEASESKPLLQHSNSHHLRKRSCPPRITCTVPPLLSSCLPHYRLATIGEGNVIFFLVINVFFSLSYYSLLHKQETYKFPDFPNVLLVLYPIIGLIADCWFGRFKIIQVSVCFLIIATVLTTVGVLTFTIFSTPLLYIAIIIHFISGALYISCFVQFTTDQLVGASGEQLSFTIYWLIWGNLFGSVLPLVIQYLVHDDYISFVLIGFASFTLLIAIFLLKFCNYWTKVKNRISNPIKHIAKVLNYARKHKYPERRSALTYWEEDYPSRIDLGKDKYGGPFTVEEVEDVKTILRLIPMIVCSTSSAIQHWYSIVSSDIRFSSALHDDMTLAAILSLFIIPIYHFLVYPFFYNCIPSMLKRIGTGFVLSTVALFVNITAFAFVQEDNANFTCTLTSGPKFSTDAIGASCYLVSSIISGVSSLLVVLTLFEFVIAQTPYQLKGFTICLTLCCFEVFSGIGYYLNKLFQTDYFQMLSYCKFYLCATCAILSFATLLCYVFVSKWYTLRKRDDIVPYHMLAENYFEKNYSLHKLYQQQIKDSQSESPNNTTEENTHRQ